MLCGCLVFTALAMISLNTSPDFHSRYGKPDVERFNVRPQFTMTVEYGSDDQPCEMMIEPRRALFPPLSGNSAQAEETDRGSAVVDGVVLKTQSPDQISMSLEDAVELLDEIVPWDMRGSEVGRSTMADWTNRFELVTYENAVVGFDTEAHPGQRARVRGISINFKRDECQAVNELRNSESEALSK